MSGEDLNKSKDVIPPVNNTHVVRVVDDEIDSRELFQSQRELRIRHDGNLYRLRLTSLNKLILTK
jgi:hemin uptake protein HemP